MSTERDNFDPHGDANSSEQELGNLVARYVDRLTDGERIEPEQILAEQPELGQEIVEQLAAFVDFGSETNGTRALGTLGDYTLRRQIGRGGMGVVYEACENSMDRTVALKVLPAGIAADSRASARFLREAQTAGKLSHPNVVPVYFTGVKDQIPFYAMEYVEGETLARMLRRWEDAAPDAETPFGLKDHVDYFAKLARAFADVADGLQHAHSKGVIHRDIKPSNLIFDGEGRLRILDFGLARLEGQETLTLSGDMMGTPLYMSPEQARRKKIEVDHRTDVYSLGATMYEALAGRPPFRGRDQADTLSQIIERDPTEPRRINPRVPRDLETIVLQCLRKDCADRYGTAEALAQDLQRFARGDAVEARPQTGLDRVARRLWRRRVPVAVTLIIVVLAGTLGLSVWRERQRELRAEYERAVISAGAQVVYGQLVSSLREGTLRRTTEGLEWIFAPPSEDGRNVKPEYRWLDEVLESLDGAVQTDPASPDAFLHRAKARLAGGHATRALEDVNIALRRAPELAPALAFRELLKDLEDETPEERQTPRPLEGVASDWYEAYRAMRSGDWTAAVSAYERIEARIRPPETEPYLGARLEVYFGKGVALYEAGRVDEAGFEFAGAGALNPELPFADFLLGRVLYHQGEEERAMERIRSALDRVEPPERGRYVIDASSFLEWDLHRMISLLDFHPDEHLRERARAYQLMRVGEYHDARRAAERAIGLEPKDPIALALLGVVLTNIEDEKEKGRKLLVDAVERAPESSRVLFLAAWGYGVLGERRRSIQLNTNAIQLDRLQVAPYVNIAYEYFFMEQFKDSLEWCEKALHLAPTDIFCLTLKVYALWKLGRREKALESLDLIHKYGPRYAQGYHTRGECLEELDRLEEAQDAYQKAVDLDPRGDKMSTTIAGRNGHFIALARILRRRDRPGRALEELLCAVKIKPSSHTAQRKIVELLALETKGRSTWQIDKRLAELERFVGDEIDDALYLPSRVLLTAFSNEPDLQRAEDLAKRAVELTEGAVVEPLIALAIVRWERGEPEEARKLLEKALALPKANAAYGKLLETLPAAETATPGSK